MRGEKLGANLPLFWNNDGKDRPKGQICPLAKKEVFDSICPFQLRYNVLTMAPIAQPYSQDACEIGYGAFSALGWAESRFGIDFLAGFFSIVIVSVIVVSLDAPPSLSSRRHLYRRSR